MKKEMLINVLQPEECRIAILEDGVLEELYVERTSHESYVGNIYKGRIVNIEPSIQAAFVDFGVGRNGFLHVSDVEPAYYRHLEGGRGNGRDRDRDRDRDRNGRGRGNARDRDHDRDRNRESVRTREPLVEEPDFFDDEPVETTPVSETSPVETAAAPAVPEETVEVAASPEVTATAPEETASALPVVEEAEAMESHPVEIAPTEAAADDAASLVAHPETIVEEDTGKRRRTRGGSGSRRKKTPAAEPAAEAKSDEEAEAPSETPSSDEPPKPQLMDSAEHRTTEKDQPSDSDDDLLFFPKPQKQTPPEPQHKPEPLPEPEWEPLAEETVIEEPELLEAPEPMEDTDSVEEQADFEEPPPPRRREVRMRGNVEDDLAADLAAADIEDAPPGEFEPVFTEETGEMEFDEEVPEQFPQVIPQEPRPERRDEPRRDDRRGGRDRDRDNRDRDRDRGRGRDRRGGPDRGGRDRGRMGGRPGMGRPKPLIQDIFKRGQEVIVQVIKEGIGTKGPTLSTYISIAGRYLVLMPGLNRVGVSRKINDDEQRRRLREIFRELKPPHGLGFIIRTAGIDKNKKELQRDLAYLSRLYLVIAKRVQKLKAPCEIYQESDMVTRTLRDTFASDVDTIWVDEPGAYEHAKEFMQIVMPRYASRLKLYDGKEPLFHKYGIEDEITRIQQRKIPLPYGGSIIIEQTEALVAIDVNSGNFRADNNAEETAYQMNLQAAKEIARQLRLRDMGGQVVVDFIDMRDEKHRRGVEKAIRDAMKRDRARTKILKLSQFGMIEMTRQRIRPSLKRSVYMDCPFCHGMAQVKTNESMSIEVMRMLLLAAHLEHVQRIEITVTEDVANYLLNKKRREIAKLEESGNTAVTIAGKPGLPPETLEFVCYDKNNNEVKFPQTDEPPPQRNRR